MSAGKSECVLYSFTPKTWRSAIGTKSMAVVSSGDSRSNVGESPARSTTFEFLPGAGIRTCSAEDLIVYKAFADRPRDWVDVEGILLRQQGRLDLELVFSELTPLSEAKESPEIVSKLSSLIDLIR